MSKLTTDIERLTDKIERLVDRIVRLSGRVDLLEEHDAPTDPHLALVKGDDDA